MVVAFSKTLETPLTRFYRQEFIYILYNTLILLGTVSLTQARPPEKRTSDVHEYIYEYIYLHVNLC